MKNNFIEYQFARQEIRWNKDLKEFKKTYKKYNFDLFDKVGLIREWRAYWWLKGKYSTYTFLISDVVADKLGIDIIAVKGDIETNFCVSGVGDEEEHPNCDYKIIVTDKKIYQKKLERKVKNE